MENGTKKVGLLQSGCVLWGLESPNDLPIPAASEEIRRLLVRTFPNGSSQVEQVPGTYFDFVSCFLTLDSSMPSTFLCK